VLYRRAHSNVAGWEAPRRVETADWLALLIVFAFICVGAIVTLLQVIEYRWEQEAISVYNARQIPALTPIQPMFDFEGNKRFINGVAGSLFVLSVEMLLIWRAPTVARLVNAYFSPLAPSAVSSKIIIELPAIRETVDRLANTRPSPQSAELGRLRASAERCFSLAEGTISQSLTKELQALGQNFEREAQELERQNHLEPV
jgi:hypothetical protein